MVEFALCCLVGCCGRASTYRFQCVHCENQMMHILLYYMAVCRENCLCCAKPPEHTRACANIKSITYYIVWSLHLLRWQRLKHSNVFICSCLHIYIFVRSHVVVFNNYVVLILIIIIICYVIIYTIVCIAIDS